LKPLVSTPYANLTNKYDHILKEHKQLGGTLLGCNPTSNLTSNIFARIQKEVSIMRTMARIISLI
jgi:hypothetical protein